MKAEVIVAVSGRDLVSIRNKKIVASGGEMMVARLKDNRKPSGALPDIPAGDRIAIPSHVVALAAGRRIGPATAGLVGVARRDQAHRHDSQADHGRC
ncbi:hypothetical protein ASG68_12115 [Rhizobium sp. Leaf453]|nr:hypothetical protein ASG68_12115 [Rhizobium sp. Leaf453]